MPFVIRTQEEIDHMSWVSVKRLAKTGETYGLRRFPARLRNLPTALELHKTNDKSAYVKAAEVGQCLVVGDDEVGEVPRSGEFWSYMEDGIAPPCKGIVRRRFENVRVNKGDFDQHEVSDVEDMLLNIITDKLDDEGKKKKKKPKKKQQAGLNKVITEVIEHEVEYEEWMDDYGRLPSGVSFKEGDMLEKRHPQVWVDPALLPLTTEEEAKALAQGGKGGGKKKGAKKTQREPGGPRKYRGKGKKTLEKERLEREAKEREQMEKKREERIKMGGGEEELRASRYATAAKYVALNNAGAIGAAGLGFYLLRRAVPVLAKM
ncbi:hypothetical protein TrRE_jg12010 [Triparma retinervis]|uniref:TAFII55 protein conserved region domain-containing protein n=1 Tax=Triparma retinervis TaxID=2557542 RepID=A0A9W7CMP2_9STRA|nr:hypothetical protein TrRE_jg12010 [Triparma retinervis]